MLATTMAFVLKKFSCMSSKNADPADDELKKQSKAINKMIKQDKKNYKATHRLLLLGNHPTVTHLLLLLGNHPNPPAPTAR